ncbi:unnamed protein product [Lactuca virosa]|uniref:Uncharacterized protein n=1 Tax=Lactuca virosa TaxID=75947 RepID=A0AAU9P9N8_9ASTR|nr:unnamed protein product [Lactuca virosa]
MKQPRGGGSSDETQQQPFRPIFPRAQHQSWRSFIGYTRCPKTGLLRRCRQQANRWKDGGEYSGKWRSRLHRKTTTVVVTPASSSLYGDCGFILDFVGDRSDGGASNGIRRWCG